ncbi:solute carrier family 35 member E4-like [Glandiceps talaboti]
MGEIQALGHVSVIGWLFLNIGIFNINKWIFVHYAFNYPIILTTLHMLTMFITQTIVIRFTSVGAAYGEGDDRMKIPPHLVRKVFILSIAFCSSIACGNIALKYLYVSFVKMIMATTPAVTVFLSRFIFDYHHDKYVYYAMGPLVLGGIFSTLGEVNFHLIGFLAAIVSTMLRSTKSILQGVLLKEERLDSVRLLYHMSFPSLIILTICSAIFEYNAFWDTNFRNDFKLWSMIILSCICSVGYNAMNFFVTFLTSAVTIQVLGNVSIILNIFISVAIFHNEVSFMSVVGIIFTVVGIFMYDTAGEIGRFMRHRISRSWGPDSKN